MSVYIKSAFNGWLKKEELVSAKSIYFSIDLHNKPVVGITVNIRPYNICQIRYNADNERRLCIIRLKSFYLYICLYAYTVVCDIETDFRLHVAYCVYNIQGIISV